MKMFSSFKKKIFLAMTVNLDGVLAVQLLFRTKTTKELFMLSLVSKKKVFKLFLGKICLICIFVKN